MLNLKKFLFKDGAPAHLPADARAALEAWRAMPAPALDEVHFHTRYVVVEITSSGFKPDSDALLSIAASSVRQSTILPDDAFFADLAGQGDDAAATMETTAGPRTIETEAGPRLDRQLLAFLQFAGKCPSVASTVPYGGGFPPRGFHVARVYERKNNKGCPGPRGTRPHGCLIPPQAVGPVLADFRRTYGDEMFRLVPDA